MLEAKEKNDADSATPLFPKLKEHNFTTKCIWCHRNYQPMKNALKSKGCVTSPKSLNLKREKSDIDILYFKYYY